MDIVLALIMIIAAGIINGSFALPTKYLPWRFENIWLQFAIWSFVVLPWLVMALIAPQIFTVYADMPVTLLWVMIIGGLFFGIGQMCFAMALNTIGIGLGFVINIGLGTALGSLIPLAVQHRDELTTPVGLITLIAVALIVIGLVFYYFAGKYRDQEKGGATHVQAGKFGVGLVLALIAGLSSAGQNFTFSLSSDMQQMALQAGMNSFAAANVFWPGFLTCGAIPYVLYMLNLHQRNQSWKQYATSGFGKYYSLIIIMALCWYGSLLLYSKSSQLIGAIGPVIGWPLFMVLIILTSNFWGWRHKEWANCSGKVKSSLITGLLLLIIAVLLLGYSASLTQ